MTEIAPPPALPGTLTAPTAEQSPTVTATGGPPLAPMTAEQVIEQLARKSDDPHARIAIERATISGTLTLGGPGAPAFDRPLHFVDCRFDDQVAAAELRAPALSFARCVLPGLDLTGASLDRLELDSCRLGRSDGGGKLDATGLVARKVTLRGLATRGHGAALVFDEARLETLRIVDAIPGPSGETPALHATTLRCERLTIEQAALTSIATRNLVAVSVRLIGATIAGHCELEGVESRVVEVIGGQIGGALRLERARVQDNVVVAGVTLGSGKLALLADHAVIEGALILGDDPHNGSTLLARGAVRLRGAVVDQLAIAGRIEELGGVDLQRARIEAVTLAEGAVVAGLQLDRATLGTLVVEPGAILTAAVRGRRLHVAGPVMFEGKLTCEGVGIELASSQLDDALHFGGGFTCEGTVLLDYCHVAGDLVMRGNVRRPGANAIDVAGLHCERLILDLEACEGGVSIRRSECSAFTLRGDYRCPAELPLHIGVACKGRIAIGDARRRTRIAGTLSLIDATCRELLVRQLDITAPTTGRWGGMALAARHFSAETLARIGNAEDADGVRATGALALDYASFGDDLRLVGVSADGLSLRSAKVRGDTILGEPGITALVSIDGRVDLSAAQLGGDLLIGAIAFGGDGTGAAGVSLAGARIAGALRIGALQSTRPWTVDLEEARVETLDDRHGAGWGDAGGVPPQLAIATFHYARLADLGAGSTMAHEEAISARLAWIERHSAPAEPRFFRAAPFHTLASILAGHGDLGGVKRVEVASRRAKRRSRSQPWYARLGDWLFDVTSGYGYAPGRALSVLLIYFLIGWFGTTLAERQGAFQPSPKLESGYIAAALKAEPHGCLWLEPPLYTIDVMLPVVSLDEEDLCSIRAEEHGWSWLRAIYRIVGSIIVSVALLTFSGLLKRDRE